MASLAAGTSLGRVADQYCHWWPTCQSAAPLPAFAPNRAQPPGGGGDQTSGAGARGVGGGAIGWQASVWVSARGSSGLQPAESICAANSIWWARAGAIYLWDNQFQVTSASACPMDRCNYVSFEQQRSCRGGALQFAPEGGRRSLGQIERLCSAHWWVWAAASGWSWGRPIFNIGLAGQSAEWRGRPFAQLAAPIGFEAAKGPPLGAQLAFNKANLFVSLA